MLRALVRPAAVAAASPRALLGRYLSATKPAVSPSESEDPLKSRDHRVIGRRQDLFMMHPVSPGSIFMLPHGTRIYNKLVTFLRTQYRHYEYDEVITPQLYSRELWEKSGHWQHYKDNMFMIDCGHDHGSHEGHDHASSGAAADGAPSSQMGLKPMNCPGHCLIFGSTVRSYRDLPMRLADFSPLHRNEVSGALTGLTRVRKFCQDDAHIFCTVAQIEQEIGACVDFVKKVYGIFGFSISVVLSTRPDEYDGSLEDWDAAESGLKAALVAAGMDFQLNPKDGAFYGPKIDFHVQDSVNRVHQTATIQLDFQMPQRFDLEYQAADGTRQRPVIVHRAILGSVERMLAILIEHTAGQWPFWLSPRHALVCPVHENLRGAAVQVRDQLHAAGFHVDVAPHEERLSKMVRAGQQAGYNFVLVVGEREAAEGTVSVRTREGKQMGTRTVQQIIEHFEELDKEFK